MKEDLQNWTQSGMKMFDYLEGYSRVVAPISNPLTRLGAWNLLIYVPTNSKKIRLSKWIQKQCDSKYLENISISYRYLIYNLSKSIAILQQKLQKVPCHAWDLGLVQGST